MLCLLISLSENWPQRPPGALTQAIWKYGDKPKKKKNPLPFNGFLTKNKGDAQKFCESDLYLRNTLWWLHTPH